MSLEKLPPCAAWRHRDARTGFETVFLQGDGSGHRIEGHTAAVEEGQAWVVRYAITVDQQWLTRTAHVWGRSSTGEREVRLVADGSGHWRVNGKPRPHLDGCWDVDLESSACTNTIPVHRLRLGVGQGAEAPAAYVRALDLDVQRLEQRYVRTDDEEPHQVYDYRSPAFDFDCRLLYDRSGLVTEYPGIATRDL